MHLGRAYRSGAVASRRVQRQLIELATWVQCDVDPAKRRRLERNGNSRSELSLRNEWRDEEVPLLATDRPSKRAHFVVDIDRLVPDPTIHATVSDWTCTEAATD